MPPLPRLCTSSADAAVDEDGRQRVEAVYRAQADRMWRALFGFSGDRDVASDALAEADAFFSGVLRCQRP